MSDNIHIRDKICCDYILQPRKGISLLTYKVGARENLRQEMSTL
jgi:hypothetical protein